ncbi:MAG: hypothetical protein ABIJ56_00545 [Pseudomonadota bacterium]
MKSPLYRCSTPLAAILCLAAIILPGCTLNTWGDLNGDGGIIEDARPDREEDAGGDTASDRGDTTTGDPITLDSTGDGPAADAPDPELTPDPVPDPVPELEPEPFCGDGNLDPGEECDDSSELCVDCRLTPPAGIFRCDDALGNIYFWFFADWDGNYTWGQMREHCRNLIEEAPTTSFAWYGLAVLTDEALWSCIRPQLDTGRQYLIGLNQRPDGAEPDGGWVWTGYNGDSWFEVAPFDLANDFLAYIFDNGCGEGEADCGRVAYDAAAGTWNFWDYGCDSSEGWVGVCMAQIE